LLVVHVFVSAVHLFSLSVSHVFEPQLLAKAGWVLAVKKRPTPIAVAAVLSPSPRNLRRLVFRPGGVSDCSESGRFWSGFGFFMRDAPFWISDNPRQQGTFSYVLVNDLVNDSTCFDDAVLFWFSG
jgi:hypothetical protein